MIEALLVLPVIVFILSLVVFFGLSMQRHQRAVMMDRYESWRGSDRAPGPSTGLEEGSSTLQLRDTFFRGDDTRVGVAPSDFFPVEPTEDWQDAASALNSGAGRLVQFYRTELPRGRSLRFSLQEDNSDVPLWERVFASSFQHRHTTMDTDWRFFNHVVEGNEWYDDRSGVWELVLDPNRAEDDPGPPTLGPAVAVREAFYSDFDRRLDVYVSSNPLARRIQDFYTFYPTYHGPELPLNWQPQGGWQR